MDKSSSLLKLERASENESHHWNQYPQYVSSIEHHALIGVFKLVHRFIF
jgi:hypothetical protein